MRRRVWLALGVALLGTVLAPGRAIATFPGTNGRIAFDDWATGQTYAINPDGTGLVQLTHLNVDRGQWAGDPAWSPDGTRIAYEASKHGEVRLWIMDADGGNKSQVTHGRGNTFDLLPVFAPDGTRLVFQRFRFVPVPDSDEGGFWSATIQSIAVDGTDRQGLTTTSPPLEVFDFDPSVSPDGQTVVFSRSNRNYDGIRRQLYSIGIDGSNPQALTPPEYEAWFPDWSPDGNRIVFTDNAERVGTNGWVMNANGTNIVEVTSQTFPHNDFQLQYSPDGTMLVFASDRAADCCGDLFFLTQMFVMNANGSGQTAVDTGTPSPHDFAWGTAPPIAGSAAPRVSLAGVDAVARVRSQCAELPRGVSVARCRALRASTDR
jgi:Tol biopolymer transport system component